LDARLTTLLCKKVTVAKSKEVKTGWSNSVDKSGRIFYGRTWLKKGCFANDDDDLLWQSTECTLTLTNVLLFSALALQSGCFAFAM
jgi:hypothetical protein